MSVLQFSRWMEYQPQIMDAGQESHELWTSGTRGLYILKIIKNNLFEKFHSLTDSLATGHIALLLYHLEYYWQFNKKLQGFFFWKHLSHRFKLAQKLQLSYIISGAFLHFLRAGVVEEK